MDVNITRKMMKFRIKNFSGFDQFSKMQTQRNEIKQIGNCSPFQTNLQQKMSARNLSVKTLTPSFKN